MEDKLDIQVKSSQDLSPAEYTEILALCTQAFRRDYAPFLKTFPNPTHILGRYRRKLVSHVLWITRWLQIGASPILRTAYIEALATDLDHRNRGFASEVMRKVVEEIQDFDIAALSTGSHGFYERLGWRIWEGPLYTRKEKDLIAMPEEQGCVMVFCLPKTPPCNLNDSLSIEWRELEPW
jgi:aminoglycoside 2'-N-acetyltransferase I